MKSNILTVSIIASYALLGTSAFAEETTTLDPIVVSADFRDTKLSQTTNSITVIGENEIYDKSTQSFVETLASTPNVNFSSGASKAKYIQIRGIGERSQYATPINPSVGLMLDGIDFSNATLGVSMFDVNQIEVLRGPQGTTFGANGMAGVVNVQSNEPTKETTGHLEATVGDYNTKAFGAAVGGTLIEDTLLGRISVYKNTSDGFMDNSYLNREDTNNIDELTTKAQLRWFASDNHTIDLNYIYLDVDNGYDAWTFDNSRTSHADEPGKDTQKTNAFALKSTYQVNPKMHLISKVSYSDSDFEYSYDEDWSYVGEFDDSLYPYSSFDQYLRDRQQTDIDVRLVSDLDGRIFNGSTDWTIGVYYKDASEDLTRNYTYLSGPFSSTYDTTNKAIYGQLDTAINSKLTLVTGLRVEDWDAKYRDSDSLFIDTDETLVGGKVGLNYQEAANRLYYVSLSKGYKPGGVNADNALPNGARQYDTEDLWNLEGGLNSSHFENTLTSRLNIFYGKRRDQQVKSSLVLPRPDGSTDFIDYLTNAAKGNYYGLESQLDYYPTDSLHLYSSIGLLQAEFDEYTDPNPSAIDMNGRTPAHSPEYQYNIGLDYAFAGAWIFKANVEGKGSYYFSNRHNEESDSYALLNSSLEYTHGNWGAVVWARNITDEDYQVRGFGSFGNNPGNGYATELYTQLGAPRTVGVTLTYDF
ncbi:TonB-dependent receptor domain-containing protein [Sulfurovum sp.]|uniref:TonB-dependent receptor n=1 Tax=Sulfurovum sp. TaxID=1969726 RepID=UPI002867F0BA|nr:TonB-dependent receptor [Sulfurovum sp.]